MLHGWSIAFTWFFLLAIWEVLQFYESDQVNTNSEQLRNQMKNFIAVSSGNILGSVLFKCPLLSNCGNLWTLFHQLTASVHSRGVSIYIAVWWWRWPDRPKRLPPLLKAISLQRSQKNRIIERTLILIMEEVQYFFILHVAGCRCLPLQPW